MQTTTERAADWHRPAFEAMPCGHVDDRSRLGLPDRYVPGRLDGAVQAAYTVLMGATQASLLHTLADQTATVGTRIAAGNLLGLLGDPRIVQDLPDMIGVAGGTVNIGLPPHEVDSVLQRYSGLGLDPSWIDKECPRHPWVLAAYRIARYPVTNAEYRVFLMDTGHPALPSSWHFRQFPIERANHPVYTVTPESADAYAQWLAQRTGRGFRLPTEAEWEWAATGPDGREFPWGNHFDADLANTAETGLFCSTPVGAFTEGASPFGLADMAGNVEEYVANDYAPYPGGMLVSDHLTQIHGRYRVARGGSFARFRDLARTRRRHGHNPRSATYAMGFRLAETV